MPEMVMITAEEYNELVRESERIAVLRELLEKDSYTSTSTLKIILNIHENKKGDEE